MTGKRAVSYLVALVVVAAALELTTALQPHLAMTASTLFFAAVALASFYGVGPGLLATILSALALDYFLIPPLHEINLDFDHFIRLMAFVVVSLLISWLSHSLRRETLRAEERAEQAHLELIERQRIESERAALFGREREARRLAEAAHGRLAFLAHAGREIASSLEVDATLSAFADLAIPTLGDLCIVYLVKPGGEIQRASVAACDEEQQAAERIRTWPSSDRLGETAIGRRVLQGERLLLADIGEDVMTGLVENDEQAAVWRAVHPVSLMIVPLQLHREVFGAVAFVAGPSGRRFTSEDLALAEELAGRGAAALVNARLYAQAQEANRMKDEFLATVSHELRTPLHAILGWSRLLRSATLSEEASLRALETIERNAHAQAQLVGDILDVSRIVTGKLKLDVHPVLVSSAVEGALDAVRPSAHVKGLEIEAAVEDTRMTVLADPERLQQAVWNLLTNAIKFTPGGGHIEVRVRRVGNEAEIRVSDTGIGIDPVFLPHVFDRFRQADSSTTRAHGGLGLGLAIVRHLVELHAGSVSAQSEGLGAGATFAIRLPLTAALRRGAAVPARLPGRTLPPSLLRGLRVLAVDDEADARELIVASLERYGADVVTAESVGEALAAMDRDGPDLLVGDIGMPGEDGYSLIRQVRARPPERGGRMPAIALTAYARREDEQRSLDAGFQIHLPKPISEVSLVEAVATLVGRALA